ncbi:FIST signal transduction protein [Chitinimonas naiadis]
MKIQQCVFQAGQACTPSELETLRIMEPHLVLVFAGSAAFHNGSLDGVNQTEWRKGTTIAGCSTAGEISNMGLEEGSIVVTAIQLDSTCIKAVSAPLSAMSQTAEAGHQLAKQLMDFEPDAILLLATGLGINGSALIRGLSDSLPVPAKLFGGLAGDGAAFKETQQLLNGEITRDHIIAVGFRGKQFHLESASEGGWTPLGPVRLVTSANENILHTLDGKPALSMYKHYLGDYAKDLPASALLFPLAVLGHEGRPAIIRTILSINEDDDSLVLAGEVKEGDTLQMMHATTDALVDGAQVAARRLPSAPRRGQGDELVLMVSCVGRKLVMGHRCEEEWEAVRDELGGNPTFAGFYSYGEIGPGGADAYYSALHNQTMTISHIYEGKD